MCVDWCTMHVGRFTGKKRGPRESYRDEPIQKRLLWSIDERMGLPEYNPSLQK